MTADGAPHRFGATGDLSNAIGGTIYSGTSDIQRKVIVAELGILE